MDMSKSIEPKSDQMNAEDLLAGPRTFTITEVREGSGSDQPFWFYLAEFPHDRPFKPSLTVRRIIVLAWGPDTDAYIGKRLTLYCDPEVKWGGKSVGGIRVSHMSGIRKRLERALAVTKGQRAVYVVDPLPDVAPAAPARAEPTFEQRVEAAVIYWGQNGVTLDQLEGWSGNYRAQWGTETLDALRALAKQMQDGTATVAGVFGESGMFPAPPADSAPADADLEPSDDERARYGGEQ